MKKIIVLGLILTGAAVFAPPARASEAPATTRPAAPARVPDTLMFTIDEYNDIQSHLSRGDSAEKNSTQAIENASLYLSTILYMGPQEWTIWVNGVAIGPHDDFSAFKVTDISARSVELLVPLSAQGMRPVRLGPNQTFVARTGIVVEGRVQ
jgi:hypothetical protein